MAWLIMENRMEDGYGYGYGYGYDGDTLSSMFGCQSYEKSL